MKLRVIRKAFLFIKFSDVLMDGCEVVIGIGLFCKRKRLVVQFRRVLKVAQLVFAVPEVHVQEPSKARILRRPIQFSKHLLVLGFAQLEHFNQNEHVAQGHAGIALPSIVFRSRVQFQRRREGFHGAGVIRLVGVHISPVCGQRPHAHVIVKRPDDLLRAAVRFQCLLIKAFVIEQPSLAQPCIIQEQRAVVFQRFDRQLFQFNQHGVGVSLVVTCV